MVSRAIASVVLAVVGLLLACTAWRKIAPTPVFLAAVNSWGFVPRERIRLVAVAIPLMEFTVAVHGASAMRLLRPI